MCKCKSEMENKLLKKITKDKPGAEDLSVELTGYGLMLGSDNKLTLRPVTPLEVKYMHTFKNGNKKMKKETINMALSLCPFCGEKVADA